MAAAPERANVMRGRRIDAMQIVPIFG